ncbi:MAG: hypothetical protein PHO10_01320 [Gemmiger sp.]|nr:hypothetical protein [Gemmiger sp.]
MCEEYVTMNQKLRAPSTLGGRVRRKIEAPRRPAPRARIPATILATCCLALALVGAGMYFKTTHTVFGTSVQESVPLQEKLNGTTEIWSTRDMNLPEGTVGYFILGSLGEADTLNSGLLLMQDGRVLLRQAGQEDESIGGAFTALPPETFRYAPRDSHGATDAVATGTALAQYCFTCTVNDEARAVTLTRLRDGSGYIGYAVQYEGMDGVGILYDPQTFNAGCAMDYALGFSGGKK